MKIEELTASASPLALSADQKPSVGPSSFASWWERSNLVADHDDMASASMYVPTLSRKKTFLSVIGEPTSFPVQNS